MVGAVTRWSEQGGARADDYDARWRRLAAAGESIHGEADLIEWFGPSRVLDAGCGTGRVAVELARRGVEAVGVDLDPAMLAAARRKGSDVEWIEGDLVDVTVADGEGRPRAFDAVVMAGNVMIFLAPGTEAAVLANMARHLRPGGRIVAGFQLDGSGSALAGYDRMAAEAGLALEHQWATWDRRPYTGGGYTVSVWVLQKQVRRLLPPPCAID